MSYWKALAGVVVSILMVATSFVSIPQAVAATSTLGAGYWHTSGNQVLDSNNQPVRAAGINWYGFETTDYVVHGLYDQDYKVIMNQIQQDGFNIIRLPFSLQMVQSNPVPSSISYYGTNGPINTDLQGLTSLQIMDKIIAYAGQIGLKVMLDCHRSAAGNSANTDGLWYNTAAGFTQQNWLNDWSAMVTRYNGNSTVVAVDLSNEPHTPSGAYGSSGATWGTGNTATDWRLAAETAGNEILGINPHLLIVVEGISQYPNANSMYQATWWGGDLEGAQQYPVTLNVPNQLVYSAHDYGPNLSQQSWFNANTSLSSLENNVWGPMWGYLSTSNTAPVWVGEFGTDNTSTDIQSTTAGSQGQWFSDLVQYLKSNPSMNWTYWALNGEDSYALLNNNYVGVANPLKLQLLQSIQFPLGGSSTGTTAPAISSLSPTSGAPGTSVTISGTNFGTTQGSSTVDFGSTAGTATSWSDTSITATVPSVAAGSTSVTVDVGGQVSSAAAFTVTTSATPASISVTPLQLSATSVAAGGTLTGTATITNSGGTSITLANVVITARPPGGTNSGGPYDNFGDQTNVTLSPGQSITVQQSRTFTSSDPTGQWYAYFTYQTADGV
ncbi:MAG: cellulase family glycosylhydrolase, partial [Bacilli bacterium]